ncbi:protein spaetzle 4-like isoform X2 [Limulus polyphemus]|uniref:Protein spaetzle 4-like isoform X2 n=1 Tax=Limulus polyphemus TaxID=6850 RepID=A0ABM1TLH6_LIMPO|nr:protein spaetzle 4-like isoform X2 [Limulus polyphemus]
MVTSAFWLAWSLSIVSIMVKGQSCGPRMSARLLTEIPCDMSKSLYCSSSGSAYPWNSVRRYIYDNQGLIRRMYGDQRHSFILQEEIGTQRLRYINLPPSPNFRNPKAAHMRSNSRQQTFPQTVSLFPTDLDRKDSTSKTASPETTPPEHPTSTAINLEEDVNKTEIPTTSSITTRFSETNRSVTSSANASEAMSFLETTVNSLDLNETTVNSLDINETTVNSLDLNETTVNSLDINETTVNSLDINETTVNSLDINETTVSPTEIEGDEDLLPQVFTYATATTSTSLEITVTDTIASTSETTVDSKPYTKTTKEDDFTIQPVYYEDTSELEGMINIINSNHLNAQTDEDEERVSSPNRVGVNACLVTEEVVAPYWANNTRGETLALLNVYPFEQYVHWEKYMKIARCTAEMAVVANSSIDFIAFWPLTQRMSVEGSLPIGSGFLLRVCVFATIFLWTFLNVLQGLVDGSKANQGSNGTIAMINKNFRLQGNSVCLVELN